jgi:hypothetical protein
VADAVPITVVNKMNLGQQAQATVVGAFTIPTVDVVSNTILFLQATAL